MDDKTVMNDEFDATFYRLHRLYCVDDKTVMNDEFDMTFYRLHRLYC
jgi:hypothetical protein